jgi:hypothetical protein
MFQAYWKNALILRIINFILFNSNYKRLLVALLEKNLNKLKAISILIILKLILKNLIKEDLIDLIERKKLFLFLSRLVLRRTVLGIIKNSK